MRGLFVFTLIFLTAATVAQKIQYEKGETLKSQEKYEEAYDQFKEASNIFFANKNYFKICRDSY